MMDLRKTERGFVRAEFEDSYGTLCSVQESSNVEPHLWLGCNEGMHTDNQCCARMHLTPELAAELIPLLQVFIETGSLPEPGQTIEANDPIIHALQFYGSPQNWIEHCINSGEPDVQVGLLPRLFQSAIEADRGSIARNALVMARSAVKEGAEP